MSQSDLLDALEELLRGQTKKGWTLHQLRHSALQHLAADGRTAPELQAKSRHLHLGSLGRYVQLGEQTSAQVTADADPAARRKDSLTKPE